MSAGFSQPQAAADSYPLPAGWVWTRLEQCADVLDCQRVPVNAEEREKRTAGKPASALYPYYGANGQVGWIDDYLFDEELLLLGEDGAPFLEPFKHKAYIIRGRSWVNNHAHVLSAIRQLTSNSFLCHYLNTVHYDGYIGGTTRPKLNQAPMRKIPVPLSPLPEQHRIVAKIEELFTKLDAGVEALKKAKAQLRRYRQAVLKSAFNGELTREWREAHEGELEPASVLLERIREERKKKQGSKFEELPAVDTSNLPPLPEGWVWTRLGLCGSLITKGESPKWQGFAYVEQGVPFVRSENVLWGSLDSSLVARIPEQFHTKLKRSQLKAEDVLVNLVGASIGRCCIVPSTLGRANINQAVALIRTNEALESPYLMHLLISPQMQVIIHANKVETARPNISLADLNYLPIPLAPLAEQHEIAHEIERQFSVMHEVEAAVEQSLSRAERVRQSILKRAFEGKLAPQDPNDEPADKLLERLRLQKQEPGAGSNGVKNRNAKQPRLV